MNRAACKLAELDVLFDLRGGVGTASESQLYFADVCAGPGGFTEYLFYRCGRHAHGWGFTLRGDCDFQLHKLGMHAEAAPCKAVHTNFKACYGVDDTGDIYRSANIRDFRAIVMEATAGVGLDLMTADGGAHYLARSYF